MRRDMELVRQILLQIEEKGVDPLGPVYLHIPGRSDDEIVYHVQLMAEARLIHAVDASHMGGSYWMPQSLTWEGHEFLDASRDKGVWTTALKRAAGAASGLSFAVLQALLVDELRQRLGLPSQGGNDGLG